MRAKPTQKEMAMKKDRYEEIVRSGAVVLASVYMCADRQRTSSLQLYGIVDVAYRHTNNEGAPVKMVCRR